ncbi:MULTISPECIES: cytochrome P450 [unclassified Streptomyces]|uniref:cytochrome P450 n=1 Tax=unclassified Streptomyces TaxID=2593676 RepID=UPI00081E9574|nr:MULTISPECIES: cytochrome P450 [unclassified Streptomyces]MYZ34442.1 cytochrome P450 [Streptomyces sp. SID4917]SCF67406.1 Cytochrome P450 [Streptomyces sp. MnatMP-M17]
MSLSNTWQPETFIQLTEYREVEEVLRRGRDFVLNGTKAESDEFVHGTLVAIDGREHLQRRRALMKMLTPTQPWGAQGHLLDEVFAHHLAHVKETVSPRDGAFHFDLIDFCRRIIWRVTAAFVGIDNVDSDERVERFLELAAPILGSLMVEYAPEGERDKIITRAREAREQVHEEMFLPSIERRRALLRRVTEEGGSIDDLPADLLTSMLADAGDEEPDLEPIFREAVALLAAAVNNPVSQAAWALDDIQPWLEAHPEDRPRIGEREFLNLAVKETLRLHRSSRPYLVRIAVSDTVLESTGRSIPAGSWVASWLGAANQDRTVFGQDADTYDPYRKPLDPKVAHFGVAFGAGPHVCLGRPMLLWEQGSEEAQGIQTKLLRLLLQSGFRRDRKGIQELVGVEGGRRFERYDVVVPVEASKS